MRQRIFSGLATLSPASEMASPIVFLPTSSPRRRWPGESAAGIWLSLQIGICDDRCNVVFYCNSTKHSIMSVDKSTVARIARLARIHVLEERQQTLSSELNGILAWIEELNEVDTDKVEPLASVTGHSLPRRDDVVTDGDRVDEVLANVPETAGGFFVVPKVVE